MSTIVRFEFDFIRFLDKDANLTQELPPFAQDPQQLISMYQTMLLTRTYDAKAVALQRTGRLGTYPSSLGQEAVSTGIAHAMFAEDILVPYYRDQAARLYRGIELEKMFAFWGGDERGSNHSAAKEDFPPAIPIATQTLHAAGVAYAIQYRQQNRAVVTTIGDGGTSKGDFYEAMNFAGLKKLPLVFVVNNNQWAISVPLKSQTGTETLAQKAIACGMKGLQVDGCDVIAVRHATAQALEKARAGEGATLIEAINYRLCDHTTADDASRYVNKTDLEAAWKQEPIVRFSRYLDSAGICSKKEQQKLQQQCDKQIEAATKKYLETAPPKPQDMFDYLYETLPQALQEQRDSAGE